MEIRFLQTSRDTNGNLLEMEVTYHAHSKEPAPHYHPFQTENFIIMTGEMLVRMEGEVKTLRQGDSLYIPSNKIHSMWNNSADSTVVNWKVQPAMDTEYLFETFAGLATDGKTNADGVPNILQVALLMNRYSDVFRLARPPYSMQRIVFALLTPVAWLLGYKGKYDQYLD